ncbi:LAFA_0F15412g1_1 [Lachancea sp. 'fantastica']|nr:LAFA_0F15412g1_1 [Lachancea sp. 'fantastica']
MLSRIRSSKLGVQMNAICHWNPSAQHCNLTGSAKTVRRSFQSGLTSLEKAKTARDLVKLVNSSSLTEAESSKKLSESHTARLPDWKLQKLSLNKKFQGEKWNPKKKLSREQMESLRLLKQQFPQMSASQLGMHFQVSPEVVRRILKSKWNPDEAEMSKIQERWKRRSDRINQLYENHSIQGPPSKKLILGSGRSAADLTVQSIRRTTRPAGNSSPKPPGRKQTKGKLQLLSKLVDQ